MFETNPFNPPAPDNAALTFLADPLITVLVLATIAVVVVAAWLRTGKHLDRRAFRPRRSSRNVVPLFPVRQDRGARRDPAQQMHAIAGVGFATVPLLNRSEARLLPALERAVRDCDQGYRLMAQTSLGEIIRPVGEGISPEALDAARFSVNAKRLDFAVFNRWGHLVASIEYQGHGHYRAESFMRDAVKREALLKAGVPFLELPADITPAEAATRLSDVLVRGAVAV